MKILVLKRDKIGDLILTTPALAVLKAALPSAEVHVLANDHNAWVVAENPHVDRLWIYRRTRHGGVLRPGAVLGQVSQFFALRAQCFDWAIAAGGEESPRAIRRMLATGAAQTVAYAEHARFRSSVTHPLRAPATGHESVRIAALIAALGIPLPEDLPCPELVIPAGWTAKASQWIEEVGFAQSRYVVIGISARLPAMQPTREQVLRWAKWLKKEHGLGTALQFTPGGPENRAYPGSEALAKAILEDAPEYIQPIPDGLASAVGVITLARTSIIPESGLMHVAATTVGGVLALWADAALRSTSARWGPLGPRAKVVNARNEIVELDDDVIFAAITSRIAGQH